MTAVDYGCPSWCERTDHGADVVDAENPPLHYGPEFGYEGMDGVTVESVTETMEVTLRAWDDALIIRGGDLPERLRDLAANLTRAAEWLEVKCLEVNR